MGNHQKFGMRGVALPKPVPKPPVTLMWIVTAVAVVFTAAVIVLIIVNFIYPLGH